MERTEPQSTHAQVSMTIVALLASALFISYFDRGILATASPLIQTEFGLSKTQLGFLFAAFYWSYAPLQPLAGWLAQRFDVRYVLGGGLALWALSTTLTGLATSITVLVGLRILLGFGESVVIRPEFSASSESIYSSHAAEQSQKRHAQAITERDAQRAVASVRARTTSSG